jgi:hypothetical protein
MATKHPSAPKSKSNGKKDKPKAKATGKAPRVVNHSSDDPDAAVESEADPDADEFDEEAAPGSDNSLMFKDDPVLDRRIIEGMLRDRKALVEELAREGWTSAAVMRRAADLGFSEAFIRQVQGVAADLAGERPGAKKTPTALGARTCLSCDRVFLSSGPGNRLCMRCRGGDAGLAQL